MTSTRSDPANNILCVETTLGGGSISVASENGTITEAGMAARAESILPAVKSILQAASLEIEQIDTLGISLGPGSFTGIRIGIATALGIKSALGIRCLGLSTTEAVGGATTDERYSVVPVGRGQFAIEHFRAEQINSVASNIKVINNEELFEMISDRPKLVFMLAHEMEHDELTYRLTDKLNVNLMGVATAENMCRLLSNGIGRAELTPIYARRETELIK